MRFFNAIFIDGALKIGKSTQCSLLNGLDLDQSLPVFKMNYKMKPTELNDKVNELRKLCVANPTKTIIIDGSVAFSLVSNDLENQSFGNSYLEYERSVKNFLNLLREIRTISILVNSDSYAFIKENRDNDLNITESLAFYKGLVHFETSQINSGFSFVRLNIEPNETMIEIHKKILKLLK